MISEANFRSLLFRLGKNFLSQEDIKDLIFLSRSEIQDKTVEEECERTTGYPRKFFDVMMERRAYNADDPRLLLEHLKTIGNEKAVKAVQKAFNITDDTNDEILPLVSQPASVEKVKHPIQEWTAHNAQTNRKEPEASLHGDDSSSSHLWPDLNAECSNSERDGAANCYRSQSDNWMLKVGREVETPRSTSSPYPSSRSDFGTESKSKVSARPVSDQIEDYELNKLAYRFDASMIFHIGLELDINKARISQYRQDNMGNVAGAFFDILIDWKQRQGRRSKMRENLAQRLKNIGCFDLADDLSMGNFSKKS